MAIRYSSYQPVADINPIIDWACREIGQNPEPSKYTAWRRNCAELFNRGKRNGPLGFHALFSGQVTGHRLNEGYPDWDEMLPVPNQSAPPVPVHLLDLDLHLYHLGVDVPVDYDAYWSFAEALSLTNIRAPNRIATGVEIAQAHVGTSSQAVASMSRPSADNGAAPSLGPKPFSLYTLPGELSAQASDIGSHLGAAESGASDFRLPREWALFVQTSIYYLHSAGTLPGVMRKLAPMVCHDRLDRVQFTPDPVQVLICVNPPQEVSEVKIYSSGQCERLNWTHGDVIVLYTPCEVEASRIKCISVMVYKWGGPLSE
ncbi:unnamed protein product [Clonostachys byssicola]|uniref:Uncharacterized protein n=1 Tax=Clonostachys byssicola TaxID=160290 RepID=A0A9N9UCW0_9HYPO|nr:unnamed protein product [Clonostachys byssicola]